MKHRFWILIYVFFTVLLITACAHLPKSDTAIITEPVASVATGKDLQFVVDTAATFIRFTGHGVGKNHPGRFKLTDGTIAVAKDVVAGGRFTINIASLQIEQPEKIYQTKLKSHLLSADFFDTAQWRTADFVLTEIKPVSNSSHSVISGANYTASGNLTLKGKTRNVTFPAKISIADTVLTAVANFSIDRTQWGMFYGNDKSLGDRFISETVTIELHLEARRSDMGF